MCVPVPHVSMVVHVLTRVVVTVSLVTFVSAHRDTQAVDVKMQIQVIRLSKNNVQSQNSPGFQKRMLNTGASFETGHFLFSLTPSYQ